MPGLAHSKSKKMKKISLLVLLFTCFVRANAQDVTVQKIKNELDQHPQEDTFHVNRLINLSFSLAYSMAERKQLSAEALRISRAIGYRRGEGIALTNYAYNLFRLGNKKEGDSLLREAESFALKSGNPELMGVAYYRKGLSISASTGGKEALDYLKKAQTLFENSKNYERVLDVQTQIGNYYVGKGSNYALAMEYFLAALQTSEKVNYPSGRINILSYLGGLYSSMGDYNNAMVTLQKAEAEFKIAKGTVNQFTYLQNSLGEAYRLSGHYPEAIKAYKLALQ